MSQVENRSDNGLSRRDVLKLAGTIGLLASFPDLLAACSTTTSHSPATGGTIRFLYNLPAVHTWDPSSVLIKPNVGQSKNIWDRLIERDPQGNLLPSLATSWQKLTDTTWQLKLRSGVTFHDGSSLTADDIKASLERYTDPGRQGSPYAGLYTQKRFLVTIKDPVTIVIDTQDPMAVFLKYLTLASILSKKTIDKGDFTNTLPNGTGPFKVDSLSGETLTLKANKNYWAGAPRIDTLVWDFVENADARISALRSGSADIIIGIPPDKDATLQGDATVTLSRMPSDELRLLFIRGPRFADPRARQAFAYAIDKEAILKNIELGKGKLATAHSSSTLLGWADMATATGTTYKYDPQKARQLLKDANFNLSDPLKYVTTAYFPKQVEVSQAITQYLQDAGVKVDLQVGEAGKWLAGHADTTVQLLDTGWPTHFWDPDEILYMVTPAMWGYSSMYMDPALADMVAHQDQLVDTSQRADYISKTLLPKLWTTMPWIPLYERTVSWATTTKVHGFVPWPSEMETRFAKVSF